MSECCNQFIMEESMDEFEMTENLKGDPGPGVAPGGTTGQILAKASDEDYDTEWIDQPELDAGHVEYDPAETYSDGTVGKELGTINSALSSLSAVTEIIDTASGAIASFPDGSGLPMRSLLAQIEPQQDLHGFDAPWVGGAGKNLFDQDACTTGKYIGETGNIADWTNAEYSDYIAVTAGQQYIFSGTNKTGAQATTRIHGYNSSKVWVQQITTESVVADANWNTTFTVPEGISFVRVSTGYPLPDGQLEKGSTASAWTPYSNECPITGWTGLSGKVCGGSDLLDGITFLTGYYWSSLGNKIQSDSMQYEEELIPVEPNATYRLTFTSPNVSNKARIQDYDSSGTFISLLLEKSPVIGNNLFFFTTSSTASFIHVSMNKNATNLSVVKAIPITCTWQTEAGTVYGGTVDVVTGVLTVDRGIIDLSTLTWNRNQPSGATFYRYLATISGATGENNKLVCSDLAIETSTAATSQKNGTIKITSTGEQLVARLDSCETAAAFTTAMSGVMLVYPLATTQTYQLSPQQILTLIGNNTVYVDTGSVSVTYQASIKGYIDKVLGA